MTPTFGLIFGVVFLCASGIVLSVTPFAVPTTVTVVSGTAYSYTAKTHTEYLSQGSPIGLIIATVFAVIGLIGFLLLVVSVYRLIEPSKSAKSHQTTLG
jgi:hypothetical protein